MRAESKIVFTGPVGVGKTTAIAAISDIVPVTTDESASDVALARKGHGHTTVAMDYGLIRIDDATTVHLFGTPGQERFNFMWEILTHGALGVVVLIDNSRPTPFQDARFFISAFKGVIRRVPMVVGITKMDLRRTPTIKQHSDFLQELGCGVVPVFEVDGRNKKDIQVAIMTLLYHLDPGLGG